MPNMQRLPGNGTIDTHFKGSMSMHLLVSDLTSARSARDLSPFHSRLDQSGGSDRASLGSHAPPLPSSLVEQVLVGGRQ